MGLQFLDAFKPDGDALLRRMSTLVDDATLDLIADEDVIGGESRRARHMHALREIRAGGPLRKQSEFASSDEFYDQDVTELLRFSWVAELDADDRLIQEWRGTPGHWARAFASAVILRALGTKTSVTETCSSVLHCGNWSTASAGSMPASSRRQWPCWHGSSG
jgi:hypothetical protein